MVQTSPFISLLLIRLSQEYRNKINCSDFRPSNMSFEFLFWLTDLDEAQVSCWFNFLCCCSLPLQRICCGWSALALTNVSLRSSWWNERERKCFYYLGLLFSILMKYVIMWEALTRGCTEIVWNAAINACVLALCRVPCSFSTRACCCVSIANALDF